MPSFTDGRLLLQLLFAFAFATICASFNVLYNVGSTKAIAVYLTQLYTGIPKAATPLCKLGEPARLAALVFCVLSKITNVLASSFTYVHDCIPRLSPPVT